MLQEMLGRLTAIPQQVWDVYGLRHEPLLGKLTPELRRDYLKLAHQAGEDLAREVRGEYPDLTPEAVAKALGLEVLHLEEEDGGSYNTFACFEEPSRITIYEKTVETAHAALEEAGCTPLLEGVALGDILMAHELYHYYEYTRPGFPTSQKLLTLWHLGGFAYRSRVVSLGEIGAMAFTQALLGISYSPYLLDVVLLYPQNQHMACQLYDYVLDLAEKAGE